MLGAFVIGLVAGISMTPHCLGMCGGFPLHLAKPSKISAVAIRLVLFVIGKSVTYMFLGSLAAALGVVLLRDTSIASAAPALRLTAGIITMIFGLMMLGLRLPAIKPLQGITDKLFLKPVFGPLLSNPGPSTALILGMCVGFLPCPLPIFMLGLATASQNVPYGILIMAGVGIGTAPGLLAAGFLGSGLFLKFAKVGMRAAGILVIAIAIFTIGRATGAIPKAHPINHVIPSCCGGNSH